MSLGASDPVRITEVPRLRHDLGALATRQAGVAKTFATLAEAWQWADTEAGPRAESGVELARAAVTMLSLGGSRGVEMLSDDERDAAGRALLSPIVVWLRRSGHLGDVSEELAALAAERPRVTHRLLPEIAPLDELPVATPLPSATSRDADEQEAMRDWLTNGEGDDEWCGEPEERRDLIKFWVEIRQGVDDAAVRARADARLLTHAVSHRQWLPAEYAELLHDDDEIWSCPEITEFAQGLRAPLAREEVGLAAASLINVKLASIIPRAFLRTPHAQVVSDVAGAVDLRALPREQLTQVATYLLTLLQRLNSHIDNRKKQPRKSDLRPLLQQLEAVLFLLHLRHWLKEGQEVPFNPVDHECNEPLPDGAPVRVTRSGLRSNDDPDFLVRPWVEPIRASDDGPDGASAGEDTLGIAEDERAA
jgi:hypothetical protein